MPRVVHVALLELKRYVSDRGALAFGIALPIALFALMYAVFSGEGFDGTAHIVDLDGGPMSRELVVRLEAVEGLELEFYTEAEAERALDRSRIVFAAFIPAGFSEDLTSGRPTRLTFRQRGSGGDEGRIVMSIIRTAAEELGARSQIREAVRKATSGEDFSEKQIDEAVDAALAQAGGEPSIRYESRAVGGSGDFLDRLLPGVLVMFLLFAVTLNAEAMVTERELGTLERLLTTRMGTNELFAGKFLAGIFRAGLQALVLLSLGFAVLTLAPFDSFAAALGIALLVAAAVSALGLVIGGFAKTRNQATWAAVLITMFMTVFGGTFFDVGESGAMATISNFTLNKHAVDLLMAAIHSGPGALAQEGVAIAVLGATCICALTAARLVFRAVEQGR